MEDWTVVITGANSGIGKAAALKFAQLDATVVMACRSMERGKIAREQMCQKSGNCKVSLLQVDMSSLESIHHFAAEYHQRFNRLDVLIHNAANFDLNLKQPSITADGIETIFATNHVGVFLLTHLLLDLLRGSSPSRILTVASKGLTAYPNLDIEFENLKGERHYSPQHAYYHSKLAQVMFTYELDRRLKGSGVSVNCIRVGNVALSDDRLEGVPEFLRNIYSLKRRFALTPESQAETYVYLASSPEMESIGGVYWDENNKQVRSSRNSYNQDTWLRLWEVSEKLAGIKSSDFINT